MAENLTVPAEFEKPKPKSPNMNLLPPSAFEAKPTKPSDPWKEIAKATEEVVKLKIENTKLKEAQCKPSEPAVSPNIQETVQRQPPDVCQYKPPKEDFRYIDELINKQACEISDLKNEIRMLKCQQREEIADIERQFVQKEREYNHQVTSLEMEVKSSEERYANQVDRLSREHQIETDRLTCISDQLQEELDDVKNKSRDRINDLQTTYEHYKLNSEREMEKLIHELKAKEVEVDSQASQIKQLKKYVGESENLPKPSDIARKERESLLAKIKTYESERESTNSTIQLLNIRLTSLNEILKLQEKELSKNSESDNIVKDDKLLLTRWREKVFALMVQQKSADIVCKKDENNWKAKVKELEQKLCTSQNQIEQLIHTLSDKDAQLDIERNNNRKLQQELIEAQQLSLCLDDRIQENVHNAQLLQEFAANVWSKYLENVDILNTALASLKAYGQRISFASGRVEMLGGLFARREALLKLQYEQGNIPERDIPSNNVQTEQNSDHEDSTYLRSELERVTKERDNLASQLKEDSKTWDAKILSIRAQVEEELESLKQAKSDLEGLVHEKNQKCVKLSEDLECCQNDLQFANQNIEDLKTSLGKQELSLQQVLDEQKAEIENQYADRLSDLDRKLNDAKREHAKAVVSLRQHERQSSREKERLIEQLSTTEEHYKRQCDLLQQQLKSVEQERNLMMATLRQEGLIGKMKNERPEPITGNWEDEDHSIIKPAGVVTSDTDKIDHVQPGDDNTEDVNDTDEPLTSVLEDLESLTANVLNDDVSDSGSDHES
ncbi:cell differentiation [Mactra antiquata]